MESIFRVTDNITKEERDLVYNGILKYNISRFESLDVKDLGVFIEIDGEIIGGILGETHGNWFEIDFLHVDEKFRKEGYGSKLLQRAEEEAKARECKKVLLTTFDFQAPKFYEKYGYDQVYVMEDFPHTGKKHFFVKTLI